MNPCLDDYFVAQRISDAGFESIDQIMDYTRNIASKKVFSTIT